MILSSIVPPPCPNEFCHGRLVENHGYINDYGIGELHCDICGKTATQALTRCKEIKEKLKSQAEIERKEFVMTVEVEDKKPRESTWGRSRYLREHIEDIKADMEKLSRKALLQKWGMSSSTVFKFRQEGLLPPATGKHVKYKKKLNDRKTEKQQIEGISPPPVQRVAEALNNHRLPAFPEFCNTWPGETQVEWLVTYREIYKRS